MARRADKPLVIRAQQRQFALEYLKDLNGQKAAVRAGYSARTAKTQAYTLLNKPHVRAFVDAALEKRDKSLELSAAKVLDELARIALSDLMDAFEPSGAVKSLLDMSKDIRRAISAIDVEEVYGWDGQSRTATGRVVKIKLWNKVQSLEALGKHLQLFGESKLRTVTDAELEAELERRIEERERAAARIDSTQSLGSTH